jgi:hypothetical protein
MSRVKSNLTGKLVPFEVLRSSMDSGEAMHLVGFAYGRLYQAGIDEFDDSDGVLNEIRNYAFGSSKGSINDFRHVNEIIDRYIKEQSGSNLDDSKNVVRGYD